MKVTVLVGGVGGARFLLGVQQLLGLGQFADGSTDADGYRRSAAHELTAVVNIGDDAWMHGVRICPDLDTCMYTLGGGVDPERGWGHRDETWHAKEELARYGVQPDWFEPRRPRSGHPSGPHPDAAGRLPARRSDRGAVRPLAAGRDGCCRPPTTAAKPTS